MTDRDWIITFLVLYVGATSGLIIYLINIIIEMKKDGYK